MILVTGASGFIGRCLVKKLIKLDRNVRVLMRKPFSFECQEGLAPDVVYGDITDREMVDKALEGVSIVIHLAAMVDTAIQKNDAEKKMYEVNVKGTETILDMAAEKHISRFIHFGSIAVYGTLHCPMNMDEESPVSPENPYQLTKYQSEQLALSYHGKNGMEVVVVRPAYVFGEGDAGNVSRIISVAQNGFFPIFGKGTGRKSFIYIENLIDALMLLIDATDIRKQIYILSDDENVSIKDLIKGILEFSDSGKPVICLPLWFGKMLSLCCDLLKRFSGISLPLSRSTLSFIVYDRVFSNRLFADEFGFKSRVSFRDGLKRTIDWMKSEHG